MRRIKQKIIHGKAAIFVFLLGFFSSICSEQTEEYSSSNSFQSSDFTEKKETPATDKKSTPSDDTATEEKKDEPEKSEEEKPKSPHTFTSNISLVSDYRFRGISQTMRRPAVQGGFDYSHENGLYLGTWASNVDGTTQFYNNTSMEWDFYGGFKKELFPCRLPDLTFNVGLICYYYPGGKTQTRRSAHYNTAEYFVELSYKWLSVKCWQTFTNYFGIGSNNPPFNWNRNRYDTPNGSSKGSIYLEANATFEIYKEKCLPQVPFKLQKLTLLVHVGHETVRHYSHLSYTDWRATLTQELAWFNVFLSYVGTDARHSYYNVPDNAFSPDKRHLGGQALVFGAIRTF